MHDYFHRLPRCTICQNVGFLTRDPLPTRKVPKGEKCKKPSVKDFDNYDSVYEPLTSFKPRTIRKVINLLINANNLNYVLFECTKCRVVVHARCCGGSFPTLDLTSIHTLLARFSTMPIADQQRDFLRIVKQMEWMCDYCCEEEQVRNLNQTCQICKSPSNEPEILKTVLSGGKRQYVHLFCCFWFSEVEATDLETYDRITGQELVKAKVEHKCELCGEVQGAKIKCSDRNCKVWFHPICGKARRTMHFETVAPVN
jgi:hypothetical protein